MGTKRPSCTVFDTSSNINTSDRKLQPGGKISREPSPRPAMTAQSERERDSNREEDCRRERETEKMRDKPRYKDVDPRDKYYERDRDRAPAPRPREGEREWRERERRQEGDRSRNGRPVSHLEQTVRGVERGMKKGDTFPRMSKNSADHGKRMATTTKVDEERAERRHRDRPKRVDQDDWERERERAQQRERYREGGRDDVRSRGKEEGKRPVEDEKSRKRERYQGADVGFQDRRREVGDPRDKRERDAARKREKPRPYVGEREAKVPSPHRRRYVDPDRKEREMAQRGEGRRDTRSEGDSDDREQKRERVRDKEIQELTYKHSRSEGDKPGTTQRERDRDRQGHRDEDKQKYRDREVDQSRRKGREEDRERYREADKIREEDRWKEGGRDMKGDRREEDRYREHKQRRGRETKEREADPSWDDQTGRSSRPQNETTLRPPRAQSSGDWSSDMDSDMRHRRGRDSYEERESGRESTADSDRDLDEQRNPAAERSQREEKRSERERRRMWLEPQRGKNSKDESVERERHTGGKERTREDERSVEWEREGRLVKEEPYEKYLDHRGRHEHRGHTEKETEGVSVDEEEVGEVWREEDKGGRELSDSAEGVEGSRQRDAEGENVTDDTEESDREEEGGSEGGSDTGWRQDRDRMPSGEDGSVSSGGDGEDEREEDEEDKFEDCPEFPEAAYDGNSPVDIEGDKESAIGKEDEEDEEEEGREKYVFCVIGQTLLRPKEVSPSQVDHTGGNSDAQQPHDDLTRYDEHPIINNTESRSDATGETTEEDVRYRKGMRSKVENPYAEIGTIKRDSRTEKLLVEWREKNQHGVEGEKEQVNFEQIQPFLEEGINSGVMSPEEVEAIRIRMSGAWIMYDEPKRHSQAPHLKWAKDVVREILGRSEEKDVDEDQGVDQSGTAMENDKQQEDAEEVPVVRLRKPKQRSEPEPELEEEDPLEVDGLRGMGQSQADMHADQFTVMHGGDTPTHTHADTLLDTEGKEDHRMDKDTGQLQLEKATIEVKISEEEAGDEVKLSEMEKETREKEVEMYLSVSNTLYKPNSCPILNYETESELLVPFREDGGQAEEDTTSGSEEEKQGEKEGGTAEEVGEDTEVDGRGVEAVAERKTAGVTVTSSVSFRDLGPEARFRRRGIRKTTERKKNGELVEVEEEEEGGVGRDRRTRIFSITDDEDDKSKSWGEVELRNVLDTIDRRKRNSKFFNAAQLYQQYSEAAQNFEILRQARSDVLSVCEDPTASPAPSPPPARRPLPPLPPVPHPHSLSHTGSITSIKSLPVPLPPSSGCRPSSPRLSIALSQSATLWRELPGVRNSVELEELTEDERRLQEVRFEVVTSEASYCRSLDIVVEHFVKCKQLGSLLATQDRNWLFSRLADVRAISHSFLSKLEERVEDDIIHFPVCDIIARHCQRFKMVYVPYLTNQSYQDATYQRLMNENPGFKRIVEKLERSPVCQRLPLRSFLVLPFQRITRIKLLVQNIVKRTTPGTTEATQAIKSLKLLEKLIQESNDSITQMRSIESLVCLSAKVDFECRTLPLISQSRRLVREGPVTELMDFSLKETERNIYLHLFNDYLLLSLQKEGGKFTVIDHAPVSDLRAENCRVKLHSLQKNLFRLHLTSRALLLRTDTQSDKLRWISALSRPHPDIDFSAAQDFKQMQCIRAIVSHQPDEVSLEKADIILVHQQSSDHWVEGTRLSDRHRGWVPESHLETITNSRVRQRNLSDALKLTTATAAV